MQLSGHNFNNDVFDSLLDGISEDVELKKTAQTKQTPDVSGFFSSTTIEDLQNIQRDELDFIASELSFAANRAKIAVNAEDLAHFAARVSREGLRGKALERAAQKYCSQLDREIAGPQAAIKLSASDLINALSSHKVIPAGYNPEHGSNDSITGKFMGSSKNPNTIWDTDALQKQAQIALGDEQIKTSKKAQEEYKTEMKTAQWQELHDKHSDPQQLHEGVANIGASQNEPMNQNLPSNTMSIFNDDRDFSNIPEKTIGENVIAQAEARANKKEASRNEERDIQRPMSTKDALDKLFQ
ncbi:MAG: hypothetical protein ACXAC5_03240 [Promethearchaeota archaeon]|jgi:hypothetical protein